MNLNQNITKNKLLPYKIPQKPIVYSKIIVKLSIVSILSTYLYGCHSWVGVGDIAEQTYTNGWPDTYALAIHKLKQDDCRGAWDLLWPLAKSGDHEAMYVLAEMSFEGMNIQLDERDKKDALLLLIFSSKAEGKYSIHNRYYVKGRNRQHDFIRSLHDEDVGELSPLLQCLKAENNVNTCSDHKTTRYLVPSKSDYINKIDRLAKSQSVPGRCILRPY